MKCGVYETYLKKMGSAMHNIGKIRQRRSQLKEN